MALPNHIYELLAQQIIDDYEITVGKCLDVGTGEGNLGLEIAKRSDLHVYLLDIKEEVLRKAEVNCCQDGLRDRTTIVRAPVEDLPFANDYFDLVVSRGSLFFWNDRAAGLQEIHRVLRPGGRAFVGGGVSRYMPHEEAEAFFQRVGPRHRKHCKDWDAIRSPDYLQGLLAQVAAEQSNLITGSSGTWIEMWK
jgi:ubiquinone/menaquinone biosynthesis C-methylase UbiE